MKLMSPRNAAVSARKNVREYISAIQKQKQLFNFIKPPKDDQDQLDTDAIHHNNVNVGTNSYKKYSAISEDSSF